MKERLLRWFDTWFWLIPGVVVGAIAALCWLPPAEEAEAQVGAARTPMVNDYFFSDTVTIAAAGSDTLFFPKKSSGSLHFAASGALSQSVTYAQVAYDPAIAQNLIGVRVFSRDCPGGRTDHVKRAGESSIWLPAFSSGIDSIAITNGSGGAQTFSVWGVR